MSVYPPLATARLEVDSAGIPFSTMFDDVYYSSDGGLGQARAVFLEGNGLPQRWQGRELFTIVETGFGLGLNFLATWQAWRQDAAACRQLHFVSVEKYPFQAADLALLHRAWPELAELSAQLLAQWPLLCAGFHRLHLDGGRVTLTLLLGDALQLLPQLDARADALFLDGFAPDKNPELWSPPLYQQLARLAGTGATLATYSVAGHVRQGLTAAGFRCEKHHGFGGKRHSLAGVYLGRRREPWRPAERHAIVLGAGLAGSSAANRLAARGWRVTLLERRDGPAQECSGNPVAAVLPVLSVDDNRQARLSRSACLYTWRHLARLAAQGCVADARQSGVLQLASDAADADYQQRVVAALALPVEFLRWADPHAAAQLAGWPENGAALKHGGWWLGQGGWANPRSVCVANLAAAAVDCRYGVAVAQLRQDASGWQCLAADGGVLAQAPVVVLANGADASCFAASEHLPLSRAWRQLSCVPARLTPALDVVVCGDGYLTPAWNGVRVFGSAQATAGVVSDDAHRANLAQGDALLPGFAAGIEPAQVGGRTSYRPATPDRMPLIGAVVDSACFDGRKHTQPYRAPRLPGLFIISGFGARGATWAALAGELLASQICGEPLPVERDLATAVDPARFLMRQARNGTP